MISQYQKVIINLHFKVINLAVDLKNIESLYNEELVIAGELLFESKKVIDLITSEHGLHFAKIKDGKTYEVEILHPFAKRQKVSCECSFFLQSGICKHIVATLFSIRNQSKIKQLSKTNVAHKAKPSKLVVSHILEEINASDLKQFVKSYARNDKKFETQLKVAFARKIDLADNQEKYKNILNAIVRPVTGAQLQVSAADVRVLGQVLDEFADQIEDSLALFQYREALDIYIVSFSKLEYVRSKYKNQSDLYATLSFRYHKILSQFLNQKLPFQVKQDLLVFLKEFYQRSYYIFDAFAHNVVYQLASQSNKDEKAVINTFLITLLSSKQGAELSILLALLIKIQNNVNSELKPLIKKYQNSFMDVVDILIENQENILAIKLMQSWEGQKSKEYYAKLTSLFAKSNDNNALIKAVESGFMAFGEVSFLDMLKKQISDEDYQKFVSKLESKLLSLNLGQSLLNLYQKEQNWAGLIIYLEKNPNIDDIRKYDVFINGFEPKMLAELYKLCLKKYLDAHLGDQASIYLQDLKHHLQKVKLDKVSQKMGILLKEEYQHRPKLHGIFD